MTAASGPFVVTGLGAVSAWGWGVAPLWQGLRSGRTAIGPLDRFPAAEQRTRVAAQVPPAPAGLGADVPWWDTLSLADRFAVAAAREALDGAAPLPQDATGVFFGGSTAGMFETEEVLDLLLRGSLGPDSERGSRLGQQAGDALALLTAQPLDNPAAAVARLLGLTGPVVTVSSACASGTQALGLALDALRAGEVEVALAGGADSLCRLTYSGFNALRVVDPQACRPFQGERAGMSLGEGAGVLVIEPLDRVLDRLLRDPVAASRSPARAVLRGVGNSCDAYHMTAPRPDGLGAALATGRALADAGAAPDEITFLNAHGTGTPLNDASEWLGFSQVFGDRAGEIPLTATKASIGHLLGSSGALEAVATVLCLEAGEVHPTPGSGPIDPETPAALVREKPLPLPASGAAHLAISTSFGFGGANAAAVFEAAPRRPGTVPAGGHDEEKPA